MTSSGSTSDARQLRTSSSSPTSSSLLSPASPLGDLARRTWPLRLKRCRVRLDGRKSAAAVAAVWGATEARIAQRAASALAACARRETERKRRSARSSRFTTSAANLHHRSGKYSSARLQAAKRRVRTQNKFAHKVSGCLPDVVRVLSATLHNQVTEPARLRLVALDLSHNYQGPVRCRICQHAVPMSCLLLCAGSVRLGRR